ncbi:MAG: ribonuclease E/G [Lachnospiraceae bacterium]|nr:ribonuclease E/G [Lachnospiraceae bacterium]
MGNSIVIVRSENKIITALFHERELVTIGLESEEKKVKVGDIYIGKVQNIVKNINGAFVEIAEKKICYLPLSENENPVFCDGKEGKPIKIGDEILVQIAKDTAKSKAPLASVKLNLTGRYVVLTKGKPTVGVSGKISDEDERKGLKELVKPLLGKDYGFIVRTNAAGADEKDVLKEASDLKEKYESLVTQKVHGTCYSKVYSAPPSFIWEIRDGYSYEIDNIKTDDKDIYDSIKEYLMSQPKEEQEKLEFYDDSNLSLSVLYGLEGKLQKALQDKVWLDSGAYLVIQPTEALVSIDVNTGKVITGKQNTEETFFKVNCEAAEEIAAQMRLRNLSGIIIVDFIDMKKEEHRKQLLTKLREEIAKDHITTRLIDMTPLGLVEITRQRIRKPIYEQ